MCKEEFFEKLNSFKKVPITYTDHALRRAIERNINLTKIYDLIVLKKEIIKVHKQRDKFRVFLQEKGKPRFVCVVEFQQKRLEIITVYRENIQLQKKIDKKKWS